MDPAAFHFLRLAENTDVDLSTIANVATALTVITGSLLGWLKRGGRDERGKSVRLTPPFRQFYRRSG